MPRCPVKAVPYLLLVLEFLAVGALFGQNQFPPPRPAEVFDGIITGSPLFPVAELSDGIFFAADNRRVYELSQAQRGIREVVLPRRIAGPVRQDGFGLGWVPLSDGSSILYSGVRQVGVSGFQVASTRPSGGFRESVPLAVPGVGTGAIILSDAGYNLLEIVPSAQANRQSADLRVRILNQAQAVVSAGSELFGLVLGGPDIGESQLFTVRLADEGLRHLVPQVRPWRLYRLPTAGPGAFDDLLAFYPPQRRSDQALAVYRDSVSGITAIGSSGTLGSWVSDAHLQDRALVFRAVTANGYLVYSSPAWRLAVYRFSPEHFDLDRSDDLKSFYSSLLQQRSAADSYLEVQLATESGRAGLLRSLTSAGVARGGLTKAYLAFRLVTLPVATRTYVSQAQRLAALQALAAGPVPRPLVAALLSFLAYEYDTSVGLAVATTLVTGSEDFFGSRLILAEWSSKAVSRMDDSNIAALLDWYRSLKSRIAAMELFALFDDALWDRLLRQAKSVETRESVLRR